jgi:nicotinate-nucleotide adenylyltransferase
MKIGILGGSFDPIHNGHLYMARKTLAEYGLDEVWLMPAGHSPNKKEAEMTASSHRRTMCELACLEERGIKTCSLETDSAEKSYTYRTMEKLTARYPEHRFSFILGADSLSYFLDWVHPEIICHLAALLVVNRGEYSMEELKHMADKVKEAFPADIRFVHCEKYVVSSRELREKIAAHQNVRDFLPENVYDYILEHRLYMESFKRGK